jgi:2-oxoisovalerate dehydrogenase E1 component alpha subunit
VSRAAGYGMHGLRVDGNDVFAVKEATLKAKEIAINLCKPVLIEAMSYRRGHHSTSDDSTRYRAAADIKDWHENFDPVVRLKNFMIGKNWWSEAEDIAIKERERSYVMTAIEIAEKRPKPPLNYLFEDVYETLPPNLVKQQAEMLEHIKKYPEHYSSDSH